MASVFFFLEAARHRYELKVTIPVGMEATVYRFVGKVGSGTYVFTTAEREQMHDATGGSIYVK